MRSSVSAGTSDAPAWLKCARVASQARTGPGDESGISGVEHRTIQVGWASAGPRDSLIER